MNKSLDKVLERLKNYYNELINFDPVSLGKSEVLENLPIGEAVYVIYDGNKKPQYVGTTGDLERRINEDLFQNLLPPSQRARGRRTGHTFSSKLLRKELEKKIGKHFKSKEFDFGDEETCKIPEVVESAEEVRKLLETYFLQYFEIPKEESDIPRISKLLERLVIMILKPPYND
ncbi:hypothetical protein ES703_36962 [subsurface metagenome]